MKHRSQPVLHCICFLVIFIVVELAFTSLFSWLVFQVVDIAVAIAEDKSGLGNDLEAFCYAMITCIGTSIICSYFYMSCRNKERIDEVKENIRNQEVTKLV